MTDHRPRGIRINNPGNVRLSQDHWVGQVYPGTDSSFCQFDTMAHGVRCAAKVLLGYQQQKMNTVRRIINRWAPPVENDTGSYVRAVAASCTVAPDNPVKLGEDMLARLCRAIFHHENGGDFVSDADLSAGVRMALGQPVPANPGRNATLAALGQSETQT